MTISKLPKLNVTLAKTDQQAGSFKSMLADYVKFFKGSGAMFKGLKKTFTARPDVIEEAGDRLNKKVDTTVSEKLVWFVQNSRDYVDALFAQEATNASGTVTAELIVDDNKLGTFSSLELLRLKNILEQGNFEEMVRNIPVRADDREWYPVTDDQYAGRDVFQSELQKDVKKTRVKTPYILLDPNLANLDAAKINYQPVQVQREEVQELGDRTSQEFSGEITARERAEMLARRSKLLTAVIGAIKVANEAQTIASDMTSDKLYGYIFGGQYVK